MTKLTTAQWVEFYTAQSIIVLDEQIESLKQQLTWNDCEGFIPVYTKLEKFAVLSALVELYFQKNKKIEKALAK
tara:strand:+ start:1691 stop:1912 length:222 start_codon:yes stop_codon:yes gene_type:complete